MIRFTVKELSTQYFLFHLLPLLREKQTIHTIKEDHRREKREQIVVVMYIDLYINK